MAATTPVLVTGGAGFIGSELVRQLAAAGRRVIVVDNLVNGKRANVADVVGSSVDLAVVDVRSESDMQRLLRGVGTVYHLACLGVRHSIHHPVENHEVNAAASLQLLRLARDAGVSRFVYVSSSEVYGTAMTVPMTELHPAFPHTVYGASKLAGEMYARAFHETYGMATVMVRPFNSFGPRCHHEGDSGEVIPKFLLRCMASRPLHVFGDGTQTRDFTYVADTARGILMCGESASAVGQTINLGSGREITILALANEILGLFPGTASKLVHDAPRPGDVLRLMADSTKAERLLGFCPTVSLRAGLANLLDWYRSSGTGATELLREERVHNWQVAAN